MGKLNKHKGKLYSYALDSLEGDSKLLNAWFKLMKYGDLAMLNMDVELAEKLATEMSMQLYSNIVRRFLKTRFLKTALNQFRKTIVKTLGEKKKAAQH
jgi:hypothetical protein